MRMGRSGKVNFLQGFNHGVKCFFNTDIENFLTFKSGFKWVVKNYLKVLFVSSPLLILSISYLIR